MTQHIIDDKDALDYVREEDEREEPYREEEPDEFDLHGFKDEKDYWRWRLW